MRFTFFTSEPQLCVQLYWCTVETMTVVTEVAAREKQRNSVPVTVSNAVSQDASNCHHSVSVQIFRRMPHPP